MNTLWFTKGMAVAPVARQIGRASDGGSEGTAQADPEAIVGFPAEVCESE